MLKLISSSVFDFVSFVLKSIGIFNDLWDLLSDASLEGIDVVDESLIDHKTGISDILCIHFNKGSTLAPLHS
jgi:hypothetical protein